MLKHNILDDTAVAYATSYNNMHSLISLSNSLFYSYAIPKEHSNIAKKLDFWSSHAEFIANDEERLLRGTVPLAARFASHYGENVPSEILKYLVDSIKQSSAFTDILNVMDKMDDKGYIAAIGKLRDAEKREQEEYKSNGGYFMGSTEKPNYGLERYPKTLDEFKNKIIEVAMGEGIELDLCNIKNEKSIIQSLSSIAKSSIKRVFMDDMLSTKGEKLLDKYTNR